MVRRSGLWVLSVTALGLACTTVNPPLQAQRKASVAVIDMKQDLAGDCDLLGRVFGYADSEHAPGDDDPEEGLEEARAQAREAAARNGATHVVWKDAWKGPVSTVNALAYRCP